MFQKKKEAEPIPVPLTNEDIKIIKFELSEKEKDNLSITDLCISDILPQIFSDNVIMIQNEVHVLQLADNLTGEKYKTFLKSVGGIFNKDVLNYSRKKDHGKYLLLEGNGIKRIIRLIEDEELLLFQTLKLIHGIIKDKPYMILRQLEKEEKLSSTLIYINQADINEDDLETMQTEPHIIPQEDEFEPATSSVSLFND